MMAKFFIILSALLALISNSMSIRTIGPLRVAPSLPISKECRLFSEEIVDFCTPFFLSNEQSQPDELCCSAFEYAASMDPECICDMIGNHNSSLSLNKIPTLCRVTLPCDTKINSQASSPVDPPGPHDPVSPAPSPAPKSESPAPIPSNPSPEQQSPTPFPSVAQSPESQSPTLSPSVPSPEPQSPAPSPLVAQSQESQSPTPSPSVAQSPESQSPTPFSSVPSPKPKRSSTSLAAQSHSLLLLVLLTGILLVYFY